MTPKSEKLKDNTLNAIRTTLEELRAEPPESFPEQERDRRLEAIRALEDYESVLRLVTIDDELLDALNAIHEDVRLKGIRMEKGGGNGETN